MAECRPIDQFELVGPHLLIRVGHIKLADPDRQAQCRDLKSSRSRRTVRMRQHILAPKVPLNPDAIDGHALLDQIADLPDILVRSVTSLDFNPTERML